MTTTGLQRVQRWFGNLILGKAGSLSDIDMHRGDTAFTDVWQRQRTPTAEELVQSYRGTAYACANLCAAGVASTPLRLYVTTGTGEARPKCATRAVDSARLEYLHHRPHLSQKILSVDQLEEVTDHPILTLLDQVNSELDRYTLMELTDLYMETTGAAYWLLAVSYTHLTLPTILLV